MPAVVVLSTALVQVRADLVVSNWTLGSEVLDSTLPGGGDSEFFSTVENPFNSSHVAQFGNSSVNTSYNFAWTGESGTFDVSSQQSFTQLTGHVAIGGDIYVTPSIDSTLSFSTEYDYNWPASVFGLARLGVSLVDQTLNENAYGHGIQNGNIGLGPPYGTEQINASVLLLAGHNYDIRYSSETVTSNASAPGAYGNCEAYINFSIDPAPEPATAGFIVLCTLILRRRHA